MSHGRNNMLFKNHEGNLQRHSRKMQKLEVKRRSIKIENIDKGIILWNNISKT
jgi:hypothetical protein